MMDDICLRLYLRPRIGRFAALCCLALALCSPSAGEAASAGQSGLVLLREGIGARAAAMGEAYTAVVGDQTAAYWNPAGVGALRGKDFLVTQHWSFQGIQQTYAGFAYGNERRGVALSLGVHSVGGLETRTGPSREPLGTFGIYDVNTGLSYAQRIGSHVYAGTSLRYVHETIGPEEASGVAVDLGLLYRSAGGGLTLGAAYRNWGRMERMDAERVPLPRTFRVGVAVSQGRITASADVRMPENGDRGVHLGIEYGLAEAMFLRGGYLSGSETRDFTFGLGLRRRNWRLDYAYIPLALGLGGSHRLAVGIR